MVQSFVCIYPILRNVILTLVLTLWYIQLERWEILSLDILRLSEMHALLRRILESRHNIHGMNQEELNSVIL